MNALIAQRGEVPDSLYDPVLNHVCNTQFNSSRSTHQFSVPLWSPALKFSPSLLRTCFFLAGPTATGKSDLSLRLAEALNAEILSLDSMAVFRRMDIGTAKPDVEARQKIPHHLIDLVDPHEEFSTAEYMAAAISCVEEVIGRGKTPMFVGGTGLYLRALLRGVFEGPPADWDFRNQMTETAKQSPPGWLHHELRKVDPASADRLHPNDERRVLRALEIFHATGQTASELQQEAPLPVDVRPQQVFWLHPPREWLSERINLRVDLMMERGLESEARQLLVESPPPGRTARQALGYRELFDWIEGRIPTRESAIELIKTRTRQFAKRQHTWFRNLQECREIRVTGNESAEELASRVLNASRESTLPA